MSESLNIFSREEVTSFFVFLDSKHLHLTRVAMQKALVEHFGLSKEKAGIILSLWVKSFTEKVSVEKRARVVHMANGG